MQRAKRIEIDWMLVGCGLSLVGLAVFKGPEMWANINRTTTVQEQLTRTARENAIAAQRFSAGCNTEFVINGRNALVAGGIAISTRTGAPLPEGTPLCDIDGNTAVIKNGVASDLINAPKIKDTVIRNGLGKGAK